MVVGQKLEILSFFFRRIVPNRVYGDLVERNLNI